MKGFIASRRGTTLLRYQCNHFDRSIGLLMRKDSTIVILDIKKDGKLVIRKLECTYKDTQNIQWNDLQRCLEPCWSLDRDKWARPQWCSKLPPNGLICLRYLLTTRSSLNRRGCKEGLFLKTIHHRFSLMRSNGHHIYS